LIQAWRDIPGFFDFMDIYDQAVSEATDGARFVEVGAFLGKSAAYMARAILDARKEIGFLAVDSWDVKDYHNWWTQMDDDPPNPWPCPELEGIPLFEAFSRCIHALGLQRVVQPLRETSVVAASMFKDKSLDFVFIDANHLYAGISSDIKAWGPKVKPGHLLGGHDYDVAIWPDVKRAVDEAFGTSVEHRGTSWLVRM
jgi:hypothetical protein